MLSRTANSLFWLARYMERAENVARLVHVGQRMGGLARSLGDPGSEWHSTLLATGSAPGFYAKHAEAIGPAVLHYLVADTDNPSSIISCIKTARRNARVVRTALTVDMWNALNETWLRVRQLSAVELAPDRVVGFLDWVKERSLLFNGAYASTMLRTDAHYFTQLGTFLERADSTARILDVKYHVLLPEHTNVGGIIDYYQWQAILRSVSALRSYHWIYHERLQPWLIAELLILRREMPRSLLSCCEQISAQLDALADAYGGKRSECHRVAGDMHARLRFGRIGDIFQAGLHEFLTGFIERLNMLGNEISNLYLT